MVRSRQSSRTRSASGSDSSQTSTPVALQPITGLLSLGYDSAVGSSASFTSPPRNTTTPSTCSSDRDFFSSPPRNTTTPSVCSSSDFLSSPPSWASSPMVSPPLSPSSVTTMDYTPEELSSASTIGRISIGTRSSLSEETATTVLKTGKTKETTKVTFSKSEDKKSLTKDLYQRVHSLVGGGSSSTEPISKSASASYLAKKPEEPETSEWSRKVTTSITNIGGAVMRSKTADIERMLRIKPDVKKPKQKTEAKAIESKEKSKVIESEDKKKYAKRRYTDNRHQTKTLIDPIDQNAASSRSQSVWKRQELISSPLNDENS